MDITKNDGYNEIFGTPQNFRYFRSLLHSRYDIMKLLVLSFNVSKDVPSIKSPTLFFVPDPRKLAFALIYVSYFRRFDIFHGSIVLRNWGLLKNGAPANQRSISRYFKQIRSWESFWKKSLIVLNVKLIWHHANRFSSPQHCVCSSNRIDDRCSDIFELIIWPSQCMRIPEPDLHLPMNFHIADRIMIWLEVPKPRSQNLPIFFFRIAHSWQTEFWWMACLLNYDMSGCRYLLVTCSSLDRRRDW